MGDNRKAAYETMAAWKDYRGATPLGSFGYGHAIDRCSGLLGNADAILSMLSAAAEDAGTLVGKGENSEFENRTGATLAGALDGVATMIALASFLLEDGK